MVPLIIFDDGLGELGPMTDLRASFEVRSGMLTTAGRILAGSPGPLAGFWVPERLAAVVAGRAEAPVNTLPQEPTLLCVNGRWSGDVFDLELSAGQAVVEETSGHVVAAMLSAADAESFLQGGSLPQTVEQQRLDRALLFRYPWDVLAALPRTIPHDITTVRMLDAKVPTGEAAIIGDHPVEVHVSARLYPNVVLDAGAGPIRIDEQAVIRPGAVICGPCAIGREVTVVDHALIKPNTSIGPVCKVAGEVGATVFQGCSNKGHDGHLGDAWVGKWVNLGAGTTTPSRLNTYGEVSTRLGPEGPIHKTGLVFLGAIIGDHVKTAINTRLMTGSVIGTGAMIATTAAPPAAVRRFAWLTDRGEQTFRFEKFLQTARAMMARRDRAPSEAYVEALRALHQCSRGG
jgi:UDP-N-acetylglucosamine diphosphorylase/glucosamine-1-phosphate N-acetyltransferase